MTKEKRILCEIKGQSYASVCLSFGRVIRDIEKKYGRITEDCINITNEENNVVLTVYATNPNKI